ncbi:ribbon-helix-helix protein, CopG family [Streptomyces sp. NPDC004542]|uniref:ribbon-helix-helix protein, CopG family n=1 Tax=Streptomyces sp. NPDC004542 TaxID=3154281 RepID=UPI0033AC0FB4
MHQLTVSLDPATLQALDDLADAQDRSSQEVVLEAVHRYLREEALAVRAVAERLAGAHADLLRRLGE